jgi:hypothetical protein
MCFDKIRKKKSVDKKNHILHEVMCNSGYKYRTFTFIIKLLSQSHLIFLAIEGHHALNSNHAQCTDALHEI